MTDKTRPDWRVVAESVVLIFLYIGLNSTLNLTMKYALGIYGFNFPILLTLVHMAFAFVVLGPVMWCRSKHMAHHTTLARQWKGFICIGALTGANIGLNNLSLVRIPLSVNQVMRASLPVVTAAVAIVVERKVPSREETAALTLLTLGVSVTVFEGKTAGNSGGLLLCTMGVLCAAAMLSTASRVLSEKLNVLQLTFYTAPVSCALLLPFYLTREHAQLMLYTEVNPYGVALIVVASSCVALAYNVVHNLLLQRTSAVTVTVLGEVKIVGLLLLSALLLPGESSQFTLKMTVGCVLAVAGFCMYSNAKISSQKAMLSQPAVAEAFSQEKLLKLITSDCEKALPAKPARQCPLPLLHMLRHVSQRRHATPERIAGKFPAKGTAFIVADSSCDMSDSSPLLRPIRTGLSDVDGERIGADLDADETPGVSSQIGSTLTHVNGKAWQHQQQGAGLKEGYIPLLDKSHGTLHLDAANKGKIGLANRVYEMLQLHDSAPRGFSLQVS